MASQTLETLGKKFGLPVSDVQIAIELDPTSVGEQPGNYVSWILSRMKSGFLHPNNYKVVKQFLAMTEGQKKFGIKHPSSFNLVKCKLLQSMAAFTSRSSVRGEWWIMDGQARYADGDYGDMGHEALVLDMLGSQLVDLAESEGYRNRSEKWDPRPLMQWAEKTYLPEKIAELRELDLNKAEQVQLALENSVQEALEIFAVDEWGFDQDAWNVLFEEKQIREFAMRRWGWKAVRGNNVESWTLTENDLKDIVKGLSDAYPVLYEDSENVVEGDFDPENYHGESFSLDIARDGSYYPDVPWPVLTNAVDTGDMTVLHQYRNG